MASRGRDNANELIQIGTNGSLQRHAAAGFSLYLRPTFISTWPYLGVSAGTLPESAATLAGLRSRVAFVDSSTVHL